MARAIKSAQIIEKIFFPTNVVTVGAILILVYLRGDETFLNNVLVFISLLSLYLIIASLLKKKISDENKLYFSSGIIVLLVFFLCNYFIALAKEMVFGAYSLLLIFFVIYAIRPRWKISGHTTAFTGTCTALILINQIFMPSIAFLPLVIWSRLELQAHNIAQVTAGILVGLAIPWMIYTLLF